MAAYIASNLQIPLLTVELVLAAGVERPKFTWKDGHLNRARNPFFFFRTYLGKTFKGQGWSDQRLMSKICSLVWKRLKGTELEEPFAALARMDRELVDSQCAGGRYNYTGEYAINKKKGADQLKPTMAKKMDGFEEIVFSAVPYPAPSTPSLAFAPMPQPQALRAWQAPINHNTLLSQAFVPMSTSQSTTKTQQTAYRQAALRRAGLPTAQPTPAVGGFAFNAPSSRVDADSPPFSISSPWSDSASLSPGSLTDGGSTTMVGSSSMPPTPVAAFDGQKTLTPLPGRMLIGLPNAAFGVQNMAPWGNEKGNHFAPSPCSEVEVSFVLLIVVRKPPILTPRDRLG